jgi:ABC-type lipoprotein export system ATPase subunit
VPGGAAVSIRDLTVSFSGRLVLDDVALEVAPGESVCLMGPSGSGKSTLLGCLVGTLTPGAGRVQVGDHVVTDLDRTARARLRRRSMGLMFQDPDLLPELSIVENVALVLLFDGIKRPVALAAAQASLEAVGLGRHAGKAVGEVSGGEAQRVAVARALVRQDVALLVADEPTASLDARTAGMVTDVLLGRARAMGATVILATHDMAVAQRCDRIVQLLETSPAADEPVSPVLEAAAIPQSGTEADR